MYIEDSSEAPAKGPAATEAILRNSKFAEDFVQLPPSNKNRDLLERLAAQERRTQHLERTLDQQTPIHEWKARQQIESMQNSGPPKLPETPESLCNKPSNTEVKDRETMLFRGRGFKTQFHGTTHPSAVAAYMPEMHAFTSDSLSQIPALARIRTDMKSMERRSGYAGSQIGTMPDLFALLPSQEEANNLVQLYLDSYEYVYHVLHLPTFTSEYERLWTDIPSARPGFIAVLLLIMSTVKCLTLDEPWLYNANSSSARETAVHWIQSCEDWLANQSHKHVTITNFQIRCLLFLSKQVNARKFKRTWTEAGSLIRFGMAAGLHRDPNLLRKATPSLEKEMRRRIWAVMTELELQASIDRGMVSEPWHIQSDTSPPANIRDEDIVGYITENLPNSRPSSFFTSSSFLNVASTTIGLRGALNTMLNEPRRDWSFEEVKRYTEEVEKHLERLPEWDDERSSTATALLELQLRQFLLLLHERHLSSAESSITRDFSRFTIANTAQQMIDIHQRLVDQGNHAILLLNNDVLRAGLSTCYAATLSNVRKGDLLSKALKDSAPALLKQVVEMHTTKVFRFGREQRQLWFAAAAYGYVKSTLEPDKRNAFMQEAVDTVARPYYKIMACQNETVSTRYDDCQSSWPLIVPRLLGQSQGQRLCQAIYPTQCSSTCRLSPRQRSVNTIVLK